MREIAHVGAAVFLLDGDAKQPETGELAPQVHREFVVVVDPGRARGDFPGSEVLHGVAQHVDVFAEAEIERRVALEKGFGFHW